MKIFYDPTGKGRAVYLKDGCIDFFMENDKIEKVNATLIIKAE